MSLGHSQANRVFIDLTEKSTFKYPISVLVLWIGALRGPLRVIAFASASVGADFDAVLFSSAGLI